MSLLESSAAISVGMCRSCEFRAATCTVFACVEADDWFHSVTV